MSPFTDRSAEKVGRTLDHELSLLREAILLVAGGDAPRVVVANLRFGEALLAAAQEMASDAGVRLVPMFMPDDAGADIAVERAVDD